MNLNDIIENGLTYKEYRQLVDMLVAQGKTTGAIQTQAMVDFTKLNIQRMNRLDKTITIPEGYVTKLKAINKPLTILLVGDAWCGDSAQIIPIVSKIVDASEGKINLSIISRDSYPAFTAEFKARSIPKLFILARDTNELSGAWGPRPKPAHEIMLKWKSSGGVITKEEFEKELHTWYAKDKGQTSMKELFAILLSEEVKAPESAATAA